MTVTLTATRSIFEFAFVLELWWAQLTIPDVHVDAGESGWRLG